MSKVIDDAKRIVSDMGAVFDRCSRLGVIPCAPVTGVEGAKLSLALNYAEELETRLKNWASCQECIHENSLVDRYPCRDCIGAKEQGGRYWYPKWELAPRENDQAERGGKSSAEAEH